MVPIPSPNEYILYPAFPLLPHKDPRFADTEPGFSLPGHRFSFTMIRGAMVGFCSCGFEFPRYPLMRMSVQVLQVMRQYLSHYNEIKYR